MLMMQGRIPDARQIDQIAEGAINRETPGMVEQFTPRYRGWFISIGTINDQGQGVIGGFIMNKGDWILYLGSPQDDWIPEYCYEWTGQWVRVPFEEMSKYMAATHDLTEGRPNAAFMAVFCRMLWAQSAMIDELRSRLIILEGSNAAIQSFDFISVNDQQGRPAKGFRIKADGEAEFNEITARGIINATLGEMRNIHIVENATIEGNINISSGEPGNETFKIISDSVMEGTFGNGTPAIIRQQMMTHFNIPAANAYSVSYGRFNSPSTTFDFDIIEFIEPQTVYSRIRFIRNGSVIANLSGLNSTQSITIRIGSTNKIMLYNAPASTNHINGIYRMTHPYTAGVTILAIRS